MKKIEFALSAVAIPACGALAVDNPQAWLILLCFALIFSGCAVMAGLELGKERRNRSG